MIGKGYIYKITNKVNQKLYIGQTTHSLDFRFRQHYSDSQNHNTDRSPLHCAMYKYGIENFQIEEVERCPVDILDEREIYWIDYYDSYYNGYNATLGGNAHRKYNYDEVIEYFRSNDRRRDKVFEKYPDMSPNTLTYICNLYNEKCNTTVQKERAVENCAKMNIGKTYTTVQVLDKQGNVVKTFSSIREGIDWVISEGKTKSKDINGIRANITKSIRMDKRNAYGYKWIGCK